MKNNKLIISIIALLALSACNSGETSSSTSTQPKKNYSLIFDSDYCSADNQSTYVEDENVSFTITLKDEFKDVYVLPQDLYVLKGETKASKGIDYTYSITSNFTATLSMNINTNMYVRTNIIDTSNYFKVSEENYHKALKMENIDYIQREINQQINSVLVCYNDSYTNYISPNLNYDRHYSAHTSYGSRPDYWDDKYYYSKNGNEYYYYHLDDTDGWKKENCDASDFHNSSNLSPTIFGVIDSISYETIKSNFDEDILAYKFDIDYQSKTYNFMMRFSNNRLDYLEYIQNGSTLTYFNIYYTYFEIVPELPIIAE